MEVAISVILPVYNTPKEWLCASIDSILEQSFTDFELVLINDDPSNEGIKNILSQYKKQDARIRLIENLKNIGLALSLNKGIQLAQGKYIARMDADDIALPQRLTYQYKYLEKHSDISLCGAQVIQMDVHGNSIGQSKNPLEYALICKLIPYQNPSTHPTWMYRRATIKELGLYRALPHGEDYDLLLRFIQGGKKVINLPEKVLYYRVHDQNESFGHFFEQKICLEYIQKYFYTNYK